MVLFILSCLSRTRTIACMILFDIKYLFLGFSDGSKGSHGDKKAHSNYKSSSFKKGGTFKKGDSGGHDKKGHDVSVLTK